MRLTWIMVVALVGLAGAVRAQPGPAASPGPDSELADFQERLRHQLRSGLFPFGGHRVSLGDAHGLCVYLSNQTSLVRYRCATPEAAAALLAEVERQGAPRGACLILELRERDAVLTTNGPQANEVLDAAWGAAPPTLGGGRTLLVTGPDGQARLDRSPDAATTETAEGASRSSAIRAGRFHRFTWSAGRLRLQADGVDDEGLRAIVWSLTSRLDGATARRIRATFDLAAWKEAPPGALTDGTAWRPDLTGEWEGCREGEATPVRLRFHDRRSESAADLYRVELPAARGQPLELVARFDGLDVGFRRPNPEERGAAIPAPPAGFARVLEAPGTGTAGAGSSLLPPPCAWEAEGRMRLVKGKGVTHLTLTREGAILQLPRDLLRARD